MMHFDCPRCGLSVSSSDKHTFAHQVVDHAVRTHDVDGEIIVDLLSQQIVAAQGNQ